MTHMNGKGLSILVHNFYVTDTEVPQIWNFALPFMIGQKWSESDVMAGKRKPSDAEIIDEGKGALLVHNSATCEINKNKH